MAESGKLVKLTIYSYSDKKYKSKVSEYTTLLNPENYQTQDQVKYDKSQALGASGTELKYNASAPKVITLKLLFDSTGIIRGSTGDLEKQLQDFRDLVINYAGEIHEPYYLILSWGTLLFKGRLSDLQARYTLFRPDGTPVRAEVSISVTASVDDELREAKENKQSPDVTHLVTIKAGETLPYLCYKIYGDSRFYLEVARVNRLESPSAVLPGLQLFFPPIDKTSAA